MHRLDPTIYGSLGQDGGVRVLTWNVQGRIGEWEKRQLAIESELTSVEPDLVMLQESWVEPNGNTQASLFAKHLGFHSATAIELAGFDTYPQATYWVVNAILSRWPLQIQRAVSLVDENGAPTWRHALAVTVDRPPEHGGAFLAAGTHLEHGVDRSETRSAQMNHLLKEIAELLGDAETRKQTMPAVIAGDFNAVPWSDELRRATGASMPYLPSLVLIDAWEACGNTTRGDTWSTENPLVPRKAVYPNRRLDYITTTAPRLRNHGSFESCFLAGIDRVDGTQPSDHYAVVAEVVL
ncbi:MAG: endonuclease/exonuclease/phosphatase family protein [Acidimicrobiia bacterium]|nr:endonuclease/exonuclease/phosphatase family protein [Acidimicrobiia bacterium]